MGAIGKMHCNVQGHVITEICPKLRNCNAFAVFCHIQLAFHMFHVNGTNVAHGHSAETNRVRLPSARGGSCHLGYAPCKGSRFLAIFPLGDSSQCWPRSPKRVFWSLR